MTDEPMIKTVSVREDLFGILSGKKIFLKYFKKIVLILKVFP